MASEWETVRLRDVCVKIGSGATPRGGKEAYNGGATSLIRSQNIYNEGFHRDGLVYIDDNQSAELRNVEVRTNDVLLNITGDSVARCCQVPADVLPARVNQHVAIIRPEPKSLDARFLRYVLVSHEYQSRLLALASAGATRPALTKSMIEELDIPSPPLAEQKAIAAVLGALDDKIELNRRINATLEGMARALFQSWFVDFDPVRAKLDGRKPKGMDKATAALFPDAFQESSLGEIPQDWRLGSLGELVQLRTDRVDATPAKDSIRYIALEDMPSKSIDLSNFQLGSSVNSSITAFCKGDVLFGSMRPYFHKVGLAFFNGITRTTTFVLRPKKDCFRHFALLHFFSDDVVAYSTTASVGTTIPYVRWDSMESYNIAVPPDLLLEAFEKTVSPLVKRIAAQGEESRTLASLRDTLLPKLLSGELRVPDAEKIVERTV